MQEGFTSFWFYTGDKGAKLPPNRGMKNYFSFSEISWVFFNVLARFFLHFCRCNSEVWVAKCSSLLFTEEFVWLFALPFNKRKYLPYANPAFNGKQCTLWTAGHHTSCSVLSNGFQTHGRALSNLSGLTLHLLFSFFLSILSALKFSGKKEERKVYVKDGKRLSMVFCCAAFHLPPAALCSQPLSAHLPAGAQPQILDWAFHGRPFLQPAKVHLKSSTSSSAPRHQRTPCPITDEGVEQCQPSSGPEDGTGDWHSCAHPSFPSKHFCFAKLWQHVPVPVITNVFSFI